MKVLVQRADLLRWLAIVLGVGVNVVSFVENDRTPTAVVVPVALTVIVLGSAALLLQSGNGKNQGDDHRDTRSLRTSARRSRPRIRN